MPRANRRFAAEAASLTGTARSGTRSARGEGKEAGALRKVLLVVAMVAASFAGGALVNGPGLAWLRDAAGLGDAAIEPIDPPARRDLGRDPEADPFDGPVPRRLVGASDGDKPAKSRGPRRSDPDPAFKAFEFEPPPFDSPGKLSEAGRADEDEAKRPSVAEPPAPLPRWNDTPGQAPAFADRPDPVEGAPGLGAEEGIKPSIPPPIPPFADPEVASASSAGDDEPEGSWAMLAEKLRERGVRRFAVEGEPGGTVRFRCEVPVSGLESVSQQFEAEGDDPFEAAEAAMRRIDLWRATEGP